MDRKYEWKYEWKIEGWEEWEVPTAKKLVNKFKNRSYVSKKGVVCDWRLVLKNESFEDLMNDVLLQWSQVREAFDASRGVSKETYMWHVVENKLLDIVAQKTSDKRKFEYKAKSLYELIGDDDDRPLINTIEDPSSKDFIVKISYKLAMTEVALQLTNRQNIVLQLRTDGVKVTEIARRLNIDRDTVYEDLKSIKMMFES